MNIIKNANNNMNRSPSDYRFFDLPLVSLNLLLEFFIGIPQAVVQLAILVRLERQLLEPTILLTKQFGRFSVTSLLGVQLHLKVTQPLFQLLLRSLAALHRRRFRLLKSRLHQSIMLQSGQRSAALYSYSVRLTVQCN